MDLIDRLLGHDAWTTKLVVEICATLPDETLDREFDIGHRTLRATLDHVIYNMEIWASLMLGEEVISDEDRTIQGMTRRLAAAKSKLNSIATRIADADAWDTMWVDHLDDPPREKSYGTTLAHVITHSMHHRAQLLYMLRLAGVESLPEGDVFSWENAVAGLHP